MTEIPTLLNGQWVSSSTGDWLERRDPAKTTTVTSWSPAMDVADAELAVSAAVAAAPAWRRTQPWERGEILRAAARTLRANVNEIVADITAEAGLSHAEATGEATRSPEILEYYAAMDRAPLGEVVPDRRTDVRTTVRREPLGTVLAITPWNNPVLVLVRKLAPALLAGNTVVVKPAEYTPRATHHVAKALHNAGLPAGVVNVVTGQGPKVGPALAAATNSIDGITFTGSTAVGKQLQRAVGGTPTRVQAEMGGKNALYVDQDADLDLALDAVISAGFGQAGQRCTATSRVLVHNSRQDELIDALTTRANQLRVGPGAEPANDMGPLIDADSVDRVLTAVDEARTSGAQVTTGGNRLTTAPYEQGHFMSPTVIVDTPSSRCWTEEIFGPVVSVRSVSSLQEAIDTVNASRYGLTASIFTRDLDHATEFSRQVRVGNVAVNMPTVGWDVNVPFGGVKDSGTHYKEQGQEGLTFYVRTKAEAFGLAGFRR